ncbi:putative phosphorylase b kinase regulatory subunit alpha [Thelohanellus kitauei]|uniref:Phosphorylase b kinase regulatory subunit n=1 Tax=Thelohanellus kitauei TaxID=669202 RepID=A0A0C2MI02_THEKT|nr:putative phosphorylase b kinase regulatory subunit alpha [Thelohanellus kitauei]
MRLAYFYNQMTPNEMKFALIVESALNSLIEPEYRQVMIELLMIFGKLVSYHRITHMKESVMQLDLIISQANEYFLENQWSVQGDALMCCAGKPQKQRKCTSSHGICQFFYDSAPSGEYGTMNFLSKSLLASIFKNSPHVNTPACHVS